MKTNIKTLAAALAAIISVGVLTSCSANTAQTNPEPTETTITATSQTTPETTAQPQTTSAKETTISSTKPETQTEKTTAPTSAAPPTTAPATTAASTTYTAPATTVAASTTKPATESTTKPAPASTAAPAPEWTESAVSGTRYVNTAGIYSRARAVLGAEKVKSYGLNDMVTVTAETNTGYYKLADGSFIHKDYLSTSKIVVKADTTTKKQSTTPAPSTTKATTTKKQNTSPKPAETTKRQGVTPTVDKTPVQEPTEEEIWDKMSAAEKREYFDHMAERIAYYLGVHRGNTEIILLPGLSNYAYERTLQNDKVMHDPDNKNALAAELKYGIYYQKGEWAGLKKGWNMPAASEGMAGSVGFVGFSEESINKEADRIVQAFSESAGHWSYLGDANSKYVGVGYSEGGVIILVSNENCDVVNEKLLECNGDVDLYWEKYDAGEFEIY